ncbi:efflux RND transporter periplasmic adaptor subunit [Campylobacter sp. CCUG 57310]|uniref:efflux RND transporter periplasmic adaptor subunit n=1 Tax=Campylobacter sp. CCUG 57310 TaxID=2517362 RepID=UPI001566AD28|nr:efflux RND transporter periplasmic adaptor subunit [Campylobacter sp. CCUG 57310]QKF93005.1 multidrug efflux system CmeABC, periplasmic fusion protein CmeA [Campylobacter sp. CCUG 57310]
MKKLANFSLIMGILISFSGCFKDDKANTAGQRPQMPPAKVDIIKAKKEDIPITFEYPAKIVSDQDVTLRPKVSGTLIKQYFKAGDSVKAGDKLFLIDPEKYQASYDALEASVGVASATLKNAQTEFNRVKKLYEKKAVSQKEFDSAKSTLDIANATLLSVKANSKNAKIDLGYTTVVAPFDGILGENLVDVGSFVSASATELVRLTKIDPISVKFYIADVDNLNRIKNVQSGSWAQNGANATLKTGGEIFKGKVNFIDNVVDINVGSVLAKAEFENKDAKLMPGAFASVVMDGFYQKDGFKIPQVAIQQDAMNTFVLVLKDQKVTQKNIEISYQKEDYAVVSGGLEEGDLIIINNFKKIRVGADAQVDKEKN